MANPILTKVVIDGVDVSSYVPQWTTPGNTDNPIRTADLYAKYTLSDLLIYEGTSLIGKLVQIYRGSVSATERCLFQGYVRKVEEQKGIVHIFCEDKLSQVKYVVLNRIFDANTDTEAGVISEIFKTCINAYTSLVCNSTTVQDSGTINTISKFRYRQRIIGDGLMELSTVLGWQFYYNPDTDLVYFEPKGFQVSSIVLNVGSNIIQAPKWDFNSNSLFNRIIIVGAPQDVQTQEGPHLLDGSTSGWTTTSILLQKSPVTVKVLSDLTATPTTEKIAGIANSTATYDYSVDKFANTLSWNTSTFAPTTSYYATVQYTFKRPITITRKNQSSIDTYTSGTPKDVTIIREDLQTVDDCSNLAAAQLAVYSTPFVQIENVKVAGEEDLELGYMYSITDFIQGYSYTLMARAITYSYPYRYDIVSFSDREYRVANWDTDPSQRLKKLEEQQVADTDIITEIQDVTNTLSIGPRHMYVEYYDTTGDSLIGTPTAFCGENMWMQSSHLNAMEEVYRFPGSNYFEELLYDDEYYNSVSSTGVTWNTTTRVITILAGALVTKPLTRGVVVTSVNVQFADASGSAYTTEVSCDAGATWQTITSFGVRVPISTGSDGTTTLLRVTTAGTTTLENTYKADGTVNNAAIAVYFEVA